MKKLGDRIKQEYEDKTRFQLVKKQYHIIRLDGKAFHTYTKGCKRPFDEKLMSDMDEVAKVLCSQIQGAKFAYTQSDEITIALTDFDSTETDLWFGGNIQKIASVSASMATANFNKIRYDYGQLALFDSRVFSLSNYAEVLNIFIWRQLDAMKNSVQMVAHHHLGHKRCQNKNTDELKTILTENGTPWSDAPLGFQVGRMIYKQSFTVPETTRDTPKGVIKTPAHTRTKWVSSPADDFISNKETITLHIPKIINP